MRIEKKPRRIYQNILHSLFSKYEVYSNCYIIDDILSKKYKGNKLQKKFFFENFLFQSERDQLSKELSERQLAEFTMLGKFKLGQIR